MEKTHGNTTIIAINMKSSVNKTANKFNNNDIILPAYHAILFHFPFCFQLRFLTTVLVNLSLKGFLFLLTFHLHVPTANIKTAYKYDTAAL